MAIAEAGAEEFETGARAVLVMAALRGRVVVLTGPTASGKSEVALELAERLGGEIVSVDSMQVYRGMDIGTAKPSAAERARAAHHLIDVAELNEAFDAAKFARLARVALDEIGGRGRVAILCGGTGLYFRALFHGLGSGPPADPALRNELEATPLPELLRELAERDPATYRAIDQKNARRVVRAVEVIRKTGRAFSEQRASWTTSDSGLPAFGLRRETANLHERIDRRVEWMFEHGLVEETRRLLDAGLRGNAVARQALGYRQVIEHLEGRLSRREAIDLVKLRTRQFAKRQMTWFRRQMALTWVDVKRDAPAAAVAEGILKHIRN